MDLERAGIMQPLVAVIRLKAAKPVSDDLPHTPCHHPYLACVSIFVLIPWPRRSRSSSSCNADDMLKWLNGCYNMWWYCTCMYHYGSLHSMHRGYSSAPLCQGTTVFDTPILCRTAQCTQSEAQSTWQPSAVVQLKINTPVQVHTSD